MISLLWRGIALAVVVLLYAGPVGALWQATGRSLPPRVSADTYLYLNLSRLRPDQNGQVHNPWYGVTVPAAQVTYLRFGLASWLFRGVTNATGDQGAALVVWHGLMAIAIGAALLWMMRPVTTDPFVILCVFATLMIVDAGYVSRDLTQLWRGDWYWIYGLPYARTFYPQVAVPLIFASVGTMVRWLIDRRRHWLALIVVLQFVAFVSFPYAAVVIIAGFITASAAAMLLLPFPRREAGAAMFTVMACIGIDVLWFLSNGRGLGIPGATELIHFDLSQLNVSHTIMLPFVFGCVAFFARGVSANVRVVFAGFAISFAAVQLADAALTPALLFGHHIVYFYTIAFWLPLIAIVLALATRFRSAIVHTITGMVTIAIVIFGILEARTTALMWSDYNADNGELARALESLSLTSDDVVVVPTHNFRSRHYRNYWEASYWESSWVPLVSTAKVLYSSGGRFLLPEGSSEEADRLAAYLFLRGEDRNSLGAILDAPRPTSEQAFLVGYGRELFLGSAAGAEMLAAVRQELQPRLDALAVGEVPDCISRARRIVVADYRDEPEFNVDRIRQLVAIDRVLDVGPWRIFDGRPRDPS